MLALEKSAARVIPGWRAGVSMAVRPTLAFSGRATTDQAFKLTDESHADSGPLQALIVGLRCGMKALLSITAFAEEAVDNRDQVSEAFIGAG